MNVWNWNGARWWKCDLHTHTPASSDYGKGPNQETLQKRTPKEWLLDYMLAGIDCVAVTDHNSGKWIDELVRALGELEEEQPGGYRALVLFPGVEISVNGGTHVLAILDPSKSTEDVNTLLGATRFRGAKGSSDACTESAFVDVMHEIVRAGGVGIPAHVDLVNGLCSLQGTTFEQAIDCGSIAAIEVIGDDWSDPRLDARASEIPLILGSDCHHPSGDPGQRYPGSHYTWIKMGEPTLDGLRLALMDGNMSLKRSDKEIADPNRHSAVVIEQLRVTNARYLGRAASFDLMLNPWLNAIIGGRGTGKSTLVEFARLALERMDELPSALRRDFRKYREPYVHRDEDGLLTSDAVISVIYRKDLQRFRLQWSVGRDEILIEEESETGVWTPTEGEVSLRFPVRIFSQKQIFEMAKEPLALLRIVDEASQVAQRSWLEKWKEAEGHFLTLRSRLRELDAQLAEESRILGELEDVKRKLKVFEQAGHAELLKKYQNRIRQAKAVEEWEDNWRTLDTQIRQFSTDLVPRIIDAELFDPADEIDEGLVNATREVTERLRALADEIATSANAAEEIKEYWRERRQESQWQGSVDATVKEYEHLLTRLTEEGVKDPEAYRKLVGQRQVLEERLRILESRKEQRDSLTAEISSLTGKLLNLRRELTERRKSFLNEVLHENQYVQIRVIPYSAKDTVESEFRDLIGRDDGAFERDIGHPRNDGLLGALYSGNQNPEDFERKLGDLKSRLRDLAMGNYDPGEVGDQRFPAYLEKLAPEGFDRVDLWFPEDTLEVQYSTTGDGSNFRPIHTGSPGQKTAALLAFLLSYGEEPIVLDQPEDDLDNHLIYGLIVQQLRTIKPHRQVVVVTHNANIVVNGDAELVVALRAANGQTQKEAEGALQDREVRKAICEIMEGGRQAFVERYRRIAL